MDPQLVGFHVSLLMGYADSVTYFYVDTKKITDLVNISLDHHHSANVRPLESTLAKIAADSSGKPAQKVYV